MFNNILENGIFSDSNAIIAFVVSLLCGIVIAFVTMKTSTYTKNLIISLVVLPLLVSVAIMLVNGNLGTGVAILGVFGLVRFRSLPGTSKDIVNVFFAMVVGLAIGTGYVNLGIILTIILSLVLILLSVTNFGDKNKLNKQLKIIVPEDVDFNDVFTDVFKKYLKKYDLEIIKTTNMGSLYELTYNVVIKDNILEKEFIDDLRIRNGNLKVMLYKLSDEKEL